jgi:hypothetical protein
MATIVIASKPLPGKRKPTRVEVEPVWRDGVWCAHRAVNRHGKVEAGCGYHVTHVPTGRSAAKALTKRQAVILAKRLAKAAPDFYPDAKFASVNEQDEQTKRVAEIVHVFYAEHG